MNTVQCATARLQAQGLILPDEPEAMGRYAVWRRDGDRLYTAGLLSRTADGVIPGPFGPDDDPLQAEEAARVCALRALAVAQAAVGSLDRVAGVAALRGVIAAKPDFTRHSQVLDAASEIFDSIFGPQVRCIRTTVGVSSLPAGGGVEIEVTFALK